MSQLDSCPHDDTIAALVGEVRALRGDMQERHDQNVARFEAQDRKLDPMYSCLVGEPLKGKPGMAADVRSLKDEKRKRDKILWTVGLASAGGLGLWLWSGVESVIEAVRRAGK
jgi:hypothetical protein